MEKDKLIKSFENCLSSGGCDNCPSGKEHRVFIDRDFVLTCRSLTKETLNILKNSVEVVRCKDCKFFMEYATLHKAEVEKGDGDCHIRLMNSENKQFCAVEKTDFCSYGERKK